MRKPENKRMEMIWRYGLVSIFITLMAALIVYNAFATTVRDADKWNNKADSVLNTVLYELPKRGDILACDGTVLATTLTKYDISLDYRTSAKYDSLFIAKLDSLSEAMAEHFPTRDAEQWKLYLAKPLEKEPKHRKRCHMLVKEVNYADYEMMLKFPFFKEFKKRYAHGLVCSPREVRIKPYHTMARRSIGRCNYVHEAKFEGASRRRDSLDVLHGFSGLEYALDSLLYGTRGTARYETATKGVRRLTVQKPSDGVHVRTTIDINIQDIVENELHKMLETIEADWGACIMMEVETGDIKAISNLDRDPKTGTYIEAMNYVVQAFEPGSVMKPISMIVALEDNFAPLDRVYSIGHVYAYAGGSPIRDTHSPGSLPMRRFIEYSSNIGMTKLIAPHYENNLNGFRDRLRELGFFDKYNTGIAGERVPYFPTLHPKAGGRVSLSRMSYGYSTMIPPLYTCAVYNAIANKGKYVRPRMYTQTIGRDGNTVDIPVSYVRDQICSEKNAQILMEMLHSVVYGEGGTAKSLRNDKVTIVGKTGTCRIAYENKPDTTKSGKALPRKIGYKENQYRLAFCGIFPYENPKYTCMVLISNPSPAYKGAATTSGYVVKNIALKMYAHGMLGKHSDYTANPNTATLPTIYACQGEDFDGVRGSIGVSRTKRLKAPAEVAAGNIPDVRGLGIREALARIEDAGFALEAHGSGFATHQEPAPGTPAKPGQKVKVSFTVR